MSHVRVIRKALQSKCNYKIGAVAFDKKGRILGYSFNKSRYMFKGGGIHAEMVLMARYSKCKSIMIVRVNKSGKLLPIEPCTVFARIASRLGVKIYSLEDC